MLLLADLGAHHRLPQAFAERLGRCQLLPHAHRLDVMALQRPEPRHRQIFWPAEHHRRAALGQRRQQTMGIGKAARVAKQHTHVVQRDAPLFFPILGDRHEAPAAVQMLVLPRHLDNPANHGCRGPGSSTRPISSTPTLRKPFSRSCLAEYLYSLMSSWSSPCLR